MKKISLLSIVIVALIIVINSCNRNSPHLKGDVIILKDLESQKNDPVMKDIRNVEIKEFMGSKLILLELESGDTLTFFVNNELLSDYSLVYQPFTLDKYHGFTIVNLRKQTLLYLIAPKKSKSGQKLLESYHNKIMSTTPTEINL